MKPMVRVYVAGSSALPERALSAVRALRAFGEIDVVSTWHDTDPASWAGKDHTLDAARRSRITRQTMREVESAHVLWLVYDERARGSLFEAGYALRCGASIVVSGPGHERFLFSTLGQAFRSDFDALELIHQTAAATCQASMALRYVP